MRNPMPLWVISGHWLTFNQFFGGHEKGNDQQKTLHHIVNCKTKRHDCAYSIVGTIVFNNVADPVGSGSVDSLARPGGNVSQTYPVCSVRPETSISVHNLNAGLAMFPSPWSFRLRLARYLFIP
jgi:hypothetical protein